MSRGKTKDELFILRVYELSLQADDPEIHLNRYDVGKSIGLAPKGVDTICVLLMQANFLKKAGPVDVYITPQGQALAQLLLSE